eukprot:m.810009 g.810009  ORF g.810009 m.810009 type:complete len:202 (-) comp59319_c0_seq71:195-800(-)
MSEALSLGSRKRPARSTLRATLEGVCFQSKEVIDAMIEDCRSNLVSLKVDGGMAKNNLLLQLQADLNIDVVRPQNMERTCVGAALAAGLADGVNVWQLDSLIKHHHSPHATVFHPSLHSDAILNSALDQHYVQWKTAVQRSLKWLPRADTASAVVGSGVRTSKGAVALSLLAATAISVVAFFLIKNDKSSSSLSSRFSFRK